VRKSVCVCLGNYYVVCVRQSMREREPEKERERARERESVRERVCVRERERE